MDHDHHSHEHNPDYDKEYTKFAVIILFILILSLLHLIVVNDNAFGKWMSAVMGYFFIFFSMFKFLAFDEFVEAYTSYDILAKRSKIYAYIYPFLELCLGILFLARTSLLEVNVVTLILMTISLIGVVQSMNKNFKCACLGTIIDLPLSTITLFEDLIMGGMAILSIVMITNFI